MEQTKVLEALKKKNDPAEADRIARYETLSILLEEHIRSLNKTTTATGQYSKSVEELGKKLEEWKIKEKELYDLQAESQSGDLIKRVEKRNELEEKANKLLKEQLEDLKKYAPQEKQQIET